MVRTPSPLCYHTLKLIFFPLDFFRLYLMSFSCDVFHILSIQLRPFSALAASLAFLSYDLGGQNKCCSGVLKNASQVVFLKCFSCIGLGYEFWGRHRDKLSLSYTHTLSQ